MFRASLFTLPGPIRGAGGKGFTHFRAIARFVRRASGRGAARAPASGHDGGFAGGGIARSRKERGCAGSSPFGQRLVYEAEVFPTTFAASAGVRRPGLAASGGNGPMLSALGSRAYLEYGEKNNRPVQAEAGAGPHRAHRAET